MQIINIVENLDKGAVENWLVNVFIESRKTRPDWSWTFYCILGKEGRLDRAVKEAGGKIIYSPVTVSDKLSFLRHLRKDLKAGKFDILHVHHDYLSGFYLLASAGLSFRKRILHIHNTDKALPVASRLLKKLLLVPFRRMAIHFSDVVVGISHDTLDEFAGTNRPRGKQYKVLYYGIDLRPFTGPPMVDIHKEFQIPGGAKVLLYAGRMTELKNPAFVIDILWHLNKRRDDVIALFVGTGAELKTVVERAGRYKLNDRIRLAKWRNDLPEIMKASDVFVFARKEYPKEGLGLVVVEAQAAGLPMVISPGIVEDAIVLKELVRTLPLNDNPADWCEAVEHILDGPKVSRADAWVTMNNSKFELGHAARNLIGLYEENFGGTI